jgi:hypothetical protein
MTLLSFEDKLSLLPDESEQEAKIVAAIKTAEITERLFFFIDGFDLLFLNNSGVRQI